MPQNKLAKKAVSKNVASLIEGFSPIKFNLTQMLQKINIYLATIFLLIWIFVGLFGLLVVAQSLKQGFLNGFLGSSSQTPQAQAPTQTEADLPGVGTVNISCTEQALSQAAIQKIVQSGDTSSLTADEKSKLEPCIVAKAAATPSATPAQ